MRTLVLPLLLVLNQGCTTFDTNLKNIKLACEHGVQKYEDQTRSFECKGDK